MVPRTIPNYKHQSDGSRETKLWNGHRKRMD